MMAEGPDSVTLSSTEEPRQAAGPHRRSYLFLVLESHRPLAAPARIALDGIDEIVFGRGTARTIDLAREGAVRRLTVRLEDPWLSTRHARVTRVMGRWMLEDLGAKNGCSIDGVRQARAELADGQILELGHTLFVFREQLAGGPDEPRILDASTLLGATPGLATLLPSLGQTFASLAPIARSRVSVIIEGETGTGKEVLARALHALSGRPGDFVAVNCGALPRELVEGELFGHRRGAFSGAVDDRPGLIRAADRGTLLLDEIGDLPLASQAALLRVLQEREVRPLGATRPIPVDLRVLAATHRPLDRMAEQGTFRADLLARLAGHRVALLPLRARREDLGLLLGALLRETAAERGAAVELHPHAARALVRYGWPGNVRELEKCLTKALVLAAGHRVEVAHLPEPVRRALDDEASAKHDEDEARGAELLALLREHAGNVTTVARVMGKARMQVQRWMKHHGIDAAAFRR
jgi:transcriptional regulator with AAA-type ATPase domain